MEKRKPSWFLMLVWIVIIFSYPAFAQKDVSLGIPEIHTLTEKMINYDPDSCLVLLDLASSRIDKINDEKLAAEYRAANDLRRADYWVFDEPAKASEYLEKAHGYYINHVDNKKLAEIFCLKAQIIKIEGGLRLDAIQKSIPYFEKALSYAIKQDKPSTSAFIYYETAITLQQTERWHESLENALHAVHFAELSEDSLSIAMAYFLMGRTYNYFGIADSSESYMSKAIEYGEGMSLLFTVIHTYANILLENGKTEQAIQNYERALELCLESSWLNRALDIYAALGLLQLREGNLEEAEKAFISVNELLKTYNQKAPNTLLFLARMYNSKGNKEQALAELADFKSRFNQAHLHGVNVSFYKGVADLYSDLGLLGESAIFYKKWGGLKDSLQTYTNRVQLGELKKLYLNERTRNAEMTLKNEELKQSRALQAAMGGVFIVFLLIVGGLTFYIRIKGLKETQKLKLDFKTKQLEQFIEVQEAERQRIARELHDGVGQSLAALKMQLQFEDDPKSHNHNTVERVDELCNEVRTLSHQMMPMVLTQNGLEDAIKQLLASSFSNTEVETDIVTIGLGRRFPEKVEVHLYRITQELISNILKHANATKVGVQLLLRKDALILIVEDNGVGFDAKVQSEGIGLGNINSRVDALGGVLNVRSSKENGTCVHLAIPLEALENNINS